MFHGKEADVQCLMKGSGCTMFDGREWVYDV